MLELRSVSKTFGTNKAVDEVSLNIEAGAMVGIIGRSGAGKSTLLRLINRLCDLSSGEILWRGMPVTRLQGEALSEWRACCGMVFQQFNLSPRLDVLTNVLTGSLYRNKGIPALFKAFPQSERARAILELDSLDMAHAAMQRCCTLSGGQQQRVAIARTLMQTPDIILADEPIASLDPANAETVMDTLRRINRERNITVLVNLHALDIARRYCPRIIGMAAGRVVFDGPPEALTPCAVEKIYGRHVIEAPAPEIRVKQLEAVA
ncbi:MAG: phosphonate ABC transporter ATP-binding protein [Polymorphobacter sp.]|uniref:phosphonate ABC transporter ATP-binding protein n=1 Tax=Polymorphobacter sp. TaxID=1909290 RepID=UPI003A8C05CF